MNASLELHGDHWRFALQSAVNVTLSHRRELARLHLRRADRGRLTSGAPTREHRTVWHFCDRGSGRPLILLHGIGMSHAAWNPVVLHLCSTRRVIAFDIAGFGQTPSLPDGTPPTIGNLVDGLVQAIDEIGLQLPVDIAGSSLGGCMALEAARRGVARSVVAISPPGLWRTEPPPHVKGVFGSLRFIAGRFPRLSQAAMRVSVLRELVLAVPISLGSWRMPAGDAIRSVTDLAAAADFEATFDSTRAPFVARDIAAPVTVAFGSRDWILTRSSRRRDALPPHTRWVEKRGWGHVPMWIDPLGVAELILQGTQLVGLRGSTPAERLACASHL